MVVVVMVVVMVLVMMMLVSPGWKGGGGGVTKDPLAANEVILPLTIQCNAQSNTITVHCESLSECNTIILTWNYTAANLVQCSAEYITANSR